MTDNLRYYVALNGGMKVMEGRSGSFEEIGEFFHGRTLEHLIGCRNKPEVVFAAVAFDGGFRTRDGGKSWEKIMEGSDTPLPQRRRRHKVGAFGWHARLFR